MVLGENISSSLLLSNFPGGFFASVGGELLDWLTEFCSLLDSCIVPPVCSVPPENSAVPPAAGGGGTVLLYTNSTGPAILPIGRGGGGFGM